MAKRLQTWRCAICGLQARQCLVIVATTSRKEAARLMDVPDSFLRDYGSETGNAAQIAIATSKPGTLFATKDMNYPEEYKEIPPRKRRSS
jgi:hypothetical protein